MILSCPINSLIAALPAPEVVREHEAAHILAATELSLAARCVVACALSITVIGSAFVETRIRVLVGRPAICRAFRGDLACVYVSGLTQIPAVYGTSVSSSGGSGSPGTCTSAALSALTCQASLSGLSVLSALFLI